MMRAIAALLLTLATATAMAQTERPPNIILFYADDMGIGDAGCFGCKDIQTPQIDALARAGLRLTNYYSAAPICAPSRAALLTGRYPVRIGMSTTKNIGSEPDAEGIPGSELTIAELAKTRGYATALLGKWHLGATPENTPNAQGFDEFFGFLTSCIDAYSHWYYASEPWHYALYHNRTQVYADGVHMSDLITREALKFIDANANRPFLLYAAYNAPHYTMVAQSRFIEMYKDMPTARRDYAAMVAGLDESIGKIVEDLRHRGLLEKTFIFFASDNGAPGRSKRGEGGGSNAPFREHKRSLFEGGIRSPAIITWPGHIPEGQTREQLAITMDVFPTVAELIGAKSPAGVTIDGRSWKPLFDNAKAPGHERLFFEWAGQHAVREGRWKLVENGLIDLHEKRDTRATGENAVFLSNIEADPGESKNVRTANPEVAARLAKAHQDWLKQFPGRPE